MCSCVGVIAALTVVGILVVLSFRSCRSQHSLPSGRPYLDAVADLDREIERRAEIWAAGMGLREQRIERLSRRIREERM